MQSIIKILDQFKPISLDEMDSVKLLNRTDTKYIFSVTELASLLNEIMPNYKVLTINEKKLASYRTLYFDTPDLSLFTAHQNGKKNRYKVRIRKYLDSDLCFLELKFKTNKGRTVKKRKKIDDFELTLSDTAKNQLSTLSQLDLQQALWNSFSRITLVDNDGVERLTIDLNLIFNYEEKEYATKKLIICEVKQDGVNHNSIVIRALKALHIHPMRISKYCLGTVWLKEGVKYNKFKEKILKINKIQNDIAC